MINFDSEVIHDGNGVTVTMTEAEIPSGQENKPFDPTTNWAIGPSNW